VRADIPRHRKKHYEGAFFALEAGSGIDPPCAALQAFDRFVFQLLTWFATWAATLSWVRFSFALLSANQAAAQAIPTTIAIYTYNAKGERITKTLDGATTYYNYDEHDHLVSEHGPNGSRDYIYLGDMLISTVDTPAALPALPALPSPKAKTVRFSSLCASRDYGRHRYGISRGSQYS
jgi:YD repeat-containing protein